MTLFILFIYDSDECSTGNIHSVHTTNESAQDEGESIIAFSDIEYYVVARKLIKGK